MVPPEKPYLFIGSSSEALDIVGDCVSALDRVAACVPWNQAPGFSESGSTTTFETLTEIVYRFDYALFLFTADDDLVSRGKQYKAPRDNVIWEHGLFLTALGPKRVQAIIEKSNPEPKFPTDHLGVNAPRFEYRKSDRTHCRAAITSAVQGFANCITQNRFRKIDLSLAQTWNYDAAQQELQVSLSAARLTRARSIIGNNRVTIGARLANPHVSIEEDTSIVYAPPRKIPQEINEDIPMQIPAAQFGKEIVKGTKFYARVILVPEAFELKDGQTLNYITDRRCKDVDSLSYRWNNSD